jgi:hypothetical protein
MPESNRPLLKSGTLTVSEPSGYQDLLVVECDPNRILYIRDIVITVSDTTPEPLINVNLNGKPYIKDSPLLVLAGALSFGGHLKMHDHKKPIVVQIKTTKAGAFTASAYVTGIEVER